MTRRPPERIGRRDAPPAAGQGRRGWVLLLVVGAGLIGGGLWLSRREDLVGRTLGRERSLLAGDVGGRAGKRTLEAIIRDVDRMRPEEVKEVNRALDEEWQRLWQEAVAAHAGATADEKMTIIDRTIDRGLVYKDLLFAVNPRATSREIRPSRKRGPVADSGSTSPAAGRPSDDDRFREALRRRADDRRVTVPGV